MATAKVVGAIGAAVLGVAGAGALIFGVTPPVAPADVERATRRAVPKDASHLWAKQSDGGTLLRDPLPTLDDGGCQAWATRCTDGKCKASCE